jgi:hypothetical protein
MIRLIAAAGFVVAVATSAQAITPAPIPQSDGMITQVRFGCGPGRTLVLATAWPEPPSVIPAEPSAGAITERKRAAELASIHHKSDASSP